MTSEISIVQSTPKVYNIREFLNPTADPLRINTKLRFGKKYSLPINFVLIDRTTDWGNPFRVGQIYQRRVLGQADAVDAFKDWFNNSNEGLTLKQRAIQELWGFNLVCWCKPKPCHGDVYVEELYG